MCEQGLRWDLAQEDITGYNMFIKPTYVFIYQTFNGFYDDYTH